MRHLSKAISLGGDADTLACITGGIAEAFYREVPTSIADTVMSKFDDRLTPIAEAFTSRYVARPRAGLK